MSWRKQKTHREEVTAVKRALRKAGIPFVSVKHGTGTAWAWLEINIGPDPNSQNWQYSKEWRKRTDQVLRIAQDVTGRHGDYDGEINILTQEE